MAKFTQLISPQVTAGCVFAKELMLILVDADRSAALATALLSALGEQGLFVTGRCVKCAFWRRHTEGSGDYGSCRHAEETPFTAKKLSPRLDYGCPNWMGTETT